MNESETWSPVPGFDRYEVSSLGRLHRIGTGRLLKPTLDGKYLRVKLTTGNSVWISKRVHRLVLEAFVGLNSDLEACHRNGNHTDNRLTNLYWGTRSENMRDRTAHGTCTNANKTHCKRGHEFTPENTQIKVQGPYQMRVCRACVPIYWRELRARRKAALQ